MELFDANVLIQLVIHRRKLHCNVSRANIDWPASTCMSRDVYSGVACKKNVYGFVLNRDVEKRIFRNFK